MCLSEMETTIQHLDVEKYITSFLSRSLDPPLRILIPQPSKQEPTQSPNSNKNKQTTAIMQFPTILALLAAAATSVLAQDLSGLPTCAQTCFTDNFANSACAVTDIACLCADTTFFNDVEICVLTACSTDDAIGTFSPFQG
jgi:hypothetical protein